MRPTEEPEVKAIGTIFLRREIEQLGGGAETKLLSTLSPEEIHSYHNSIASSWIPMEHIRKIYDAAGRVLFPGDPLGLQKLGESMALNHLTGVYKIFFSEGTLAFIIQQAPKIWRCYHRKGALRVEWKENGHHAKAVLENYPELPVTFREVFSGYLAGVLKLTGKQGAKIIRQDDDPGAWKWTCTWNA